jgi:uncharacterized protein (TIGR02268 family)
MGVGVLTLVRFDAPIVLASVQADTTLVKVVKGDERSLLLTLLRTPAPEEQPTLRVRYADGASPGWASFTVLAPPTGADAQVEVRRQPGPLEGCQAELAQARMRCQGGASAGLWGLVLRLGEADATFDSLSVPDRENNASGPSVYSAGLYRAGTFWLFVLTLENAPDQQAWVPTGATCIITSMESPGLAVPVSTVSLEADALAPGARGRQRVETELPPAGVTGTLILTVSGHGGRSLVYRVNLSELMRGKRQGR